MHVYFFPSPFTPPPAAPSKRSASLVLLLSHYLSPAHHLLHPLCVPCCCPCYWWYALCRMVWPNASTPWDKGHS